MFELSFRQAIEPDLLIQNRDLGTSNSIDEENYVIDIGRAPFAKNVATLFELKGVALPPSYAVFKSYDIWLITFALNILKDGSFRKLRQVELNIEYQSPLKNVRVPVTIIDVFPQTKFKKIIDGKLMFSASIDLNGKAAISDKISSIIKYSEVFELGGKLDISTDSEVVCNLSFSLLTPEIVSTGIGNFKSSRLLEKSENYMLLGDQLLMQTVIVPKDTKYLKCKASVAAVATGPFGFLPIRMESKPKKLPDIQLEN